MQKVSTQKNDGCFRKKSRGEYTGGEKADKVVEQSAQRRQ